MNKIYQNKNLAQLQKFNKTLKKPHLAPKKRGGTLTPLEMHRPVNTVVRNECLSAAPINDNYAVSNVKMLFNDKF